MRLFTANRIDKLEQFKCITYNEGKFIVSMLKQCKVLYGTTFHNSQ